MPGSLGVETMGQALSAGAMVLGNLPADLNWRLKENEQISWKYRGQITPDVESYQIRLHVKEIVKGQQNWIIKADGELWRGSKHIYQVNNLCFESY